MTPASRSSTARFVALALGVAAAGSLGLFAARVLPDAGGGASPAPLLEFRAAYEVPDATPDDQCGVGSGPTSVSWSTGPRGPFDSAELARVAAASLAWFEGAPESVAWHGGETARLELAYRSRCRSITARFDPRLGLSWEEQLRAWLERFPPDEGACDGPGDVSYSWGVDLGNRGEIHGQAPDDAAAVEALRAVVLAPGSPIFDRPTCSLVLGERRSAHEADVWGIHVESAAEIDELPALLRQERALTVR